MKTEGIGFSQNPYASVQNTKQPGKVFDKTVAESYKAPVDTYTPSMKGISDPARIEQLWKETSYATDALRKLIASAIGLEDATGQGFWANRLKNIQLNDAQRAEAQAMVSEDGFFGVTKTTERIMDFAKALVGEDASEEKIEMMRKAVQKGFDDVAKMFGGFDKLPQVTKDTYDAIMKAFDDWKGGGAAAETEVE